jgi:hypothetical protein
VCLALTLSGASAVRAQSFGPDPFQPYNQQFSAYAYPSAPDAGSSISANARYGLRGANRFQDYLNELQGAGRARLERYGIGLPYFRSAVSPSFREETDYYPNRRTARSFQETQQLLTDKYLAYLQERDPKKRAGLLREYTHARRLTARALATRGENASRILESVGRLGTGAAAAPAPAGGDLGEALPKDATARSTGAGRSAAPPLRSRTAGSTLGRAATPRGTAPEIRSPVSAPRTGTSRTPSETLNRARSLGRDRERSRGLLPDMGAPPAGARGTSSRSSLPDSQPNQ